MKANINIGATTVATYILIMIMALPFFLIAWGEYDFQKAIEKNPNIEAKYVCEKAGGFVPQTQYSTYCVIGENSFRMFPNSQNYHDENYTWIITNENTLEGETNE